MDAYVPAPRGLRGSACLGAEEQRSWVSGFGNRFQKAPPRQQPWLTAL